jgi:GNAT superfamily N-acetyltransferase
MIRVTSAVESDVPELLRFIRALAAYEKLADQVVATEAGLRRTLFGERRYAEALLARLEDLPVGFALYFHSYSTFLGKPGLYLEDLFVEPAHRGKGIGKALLARLAAIAVERDCGRLEWAVLDWNASSIAFYRALGATAMDDWTAFRLEGAALRRLAHS